MSIRDCWSEPQGQVFSEAVIQQCIELPKRLNARIAELEAEVARLRSPLTGDDARLVEEVRERGWLVSDGKYVQALLDLLSRYEHAVHDRELDAGTVVAMRMVEVVSWLRERAERYKPDRLTYAMVLEAAAADLEAQGTADPAPPSVVRQELARVRAKVLEARDYVGTWATKAVALLNEALNGKETS